MGLGAFENLWQPWMLNNSMPRLPTHISTKLKYLANKKIHAIRFKNFDKQ